MEEKNDLDVYEVLIESISCVLYEAFLEKGE